MIYPPPFRISFKPLSSLSSTKQIVSNLKSNTPAQFPKDFLASKLPAISKWFEPLGNTTSLGAKRLNSTYLTPLLHPSHTANFELLTKDPQGASTFTRLQAPISYILEFQNHLLSTNDSLNAQDNPGIYLTQTPISALPAPLSQDLPFPVDHILPNIDNNNSSIWIGFRHTYTPLHRDPYSNVFVQLASSKRVRMLPPSSGQSVYDAYQHNLGRADAGRRRGEEMMIGDQRDVLESWIWGLSDEDVEGVEGLEAQLDEGDGLHIPLGWWHSVRGGGDGVNASVSLLSLIIRNFTKTYWVNWWFATSNS